MIVRRLNDIMKKMVTREKVSQAIEDIEKMALKQPLKT